MTETSKHGVNKREKHDASAFYARDLGIPGESKLKPRPVKPIDASRTDQIMVGSAQSLLPFCPSDSVGLIFTSPPYHVGKEYDTDQSMLDYLVTMDSVFKECYRVLVPGGRLVVNVANLGRKPYIRLNDMIAQNLENHGFLGRAEIIWVKAEGASGNVAWGSWNSASNPVIRDVHEYLLVFCKEYYGRPDKGTSTMTSEQFMESTLSIWKVRPESAKRIGHPAPFPVELAERVINLYSFKEDVILDPFVGSGTTCVAAKQLGRRYIGIDNHLPYVEAARTRLDRIIEGVSL